MEKISKAIKERINRFINFLSVSDGFTSGIGAVIFDSKIDEINNSIIDALNSTAQGSVFTLSEVGDLSLSATNRIRPILILVGNDQEIPLSLTEKIDGVVRASGFEAEVV